LGCGTDDALIGVRVKVDADGTVTGEPEVVDMYTNCLWTGLDGRPDSWVPP